MKRPIWISTMILMLVLTACGNAAVPPPISTIPLNTGVSNSESSAPIKTDGVVASAEVHPVESVGLSFPLLGTVKTVEIEVGDKVTAGQTLATLDTNIIEARIAEAKANVIAAETQVTYLKRVGVGNAYERIDAAQADVDRAQAMVDQLKAQYEQAILTTPVSGTVIKVDVNPGETAVPGQVIFVIADLSHMHIETTDLSERDIAAVQIGQTASVFIDALNKSFDGKVADIARQSEIVGGDVTYKVTIELNEQPAGLRWGMSAEADIQTK